MRRGLLGRCMGVSQKGGEGAALGMWFFHGGV